MSNEQSLFDELKSYGYGDVHFGVDAASGLTAIVAVHDTVLGPALGGCRFVHYDSDRAALTDALRLARGMAYKAAITGLPHGGGKAVIKKPVGDFDRAALFQAFGKFVDSLGGRYITAEDSGTKTADMEDIGKFTKHVTGLSPDSKLATNGGGGDPSPHTARGVFRGIQASAKFALGRDSLEGLHVAVQGVGNVGGYLCRELHQAGAKLTVADIDQARAQAIASEFGAALSTTAEILKTECDILAPCALGGAINDETLPALKCKIVAGAANNQLLREEHGDRLHKAGIFYAPDYAINAGGLVSVAQEYAGYDLQKVKDRVEKIYETIYEVLERAKRENVSSHRIADRMAEEVIEAKRKAG